MNVQRLMGPMILLLYQTAPIAVAPDSTGRYAIVLGYGAGEYELRRFNCAGDLIGVDPVPFKNRGVAADAWLTNRVRVTAAASTVSELGETRARSGVLFAYEGGSIGYGAGVTAWQGLLHACGSNDCGPGFEPFREPAQVHPTGYLRLGDADALHWRSDLLFPRANPASTGVIRSGVAYNQGRRAGVSLFAGLAAAGSNLDPDGSVGVLWFGEVFVPLVDGFDVMLQGAWGPSEQFRNDGWGVGGRFRFGR